MSIFAFALCNYEIPGSKCEAMIELFRFLAQMRQTEDNIRDKRRSNLYVYITEMKLWLSLRLSFRMRALLRMLSFGHQPGKMHECLSVSNEQAI